MREPPNYLCPQSPRAKFGWKISAANFKETDEKCGEILTKFLVDFRPSISREMGRKKFHTNSSSHQDLEFHTAEPKFFHSDTLGVGEHPRQPTFFLRLRLLLYFRQTPEGCGGPGGENPGAFPKLGPIFQQPFFLAGNWQRGSTGVQRYGCIPRSAANNLGQIPQKLGAPNPLF